jgi:hypothetical protein
VAGPLVSVATGVGGMRVGNGARSAPSGRGKGRRGSGKPGKPGSGGFPGSPGTLQFPRPAATARYARPVPCTFHGHPRGASICLGRQEWGSGGNLEPGRGFRGRGGSGCSSSAFPYWSPLVSVYSHSRAVVFPASPSCLVEGVRSGTRKRRGASTYVQAAGGPGRKHRVQRPHERARGLYGHYIVAVAPEFEASHLALISTDV